MVCGVFTQQAIRTVLLKLGCLFSWTLVKCGDFLYYFQTLYIYIAMLRQCSSKIQILNGKKIWSVTLISTISQQK